MRRTGEGMPVQEGLHRQNNLYGVDLHLSGEHDPAAVEDYILLQEKTHIAEGLKLMQRTTRTLPFVDGYTRGFGDVPMVEVNDKGHRQAQKQYLAGDEAAEGLARRRRHDISIAEQGDELMRNGKIGDGFMVATPYGEEWDDTTAARLGFWPEHRRSYMWFYRKVSNDKLECTDVSVDRSSLEAYKSLLAEQGHEIPEDTDSHDIPSFAVYFHASTEAEREEVIDEALAGYRRLNDDPAALSADDAFEAIDFLDVHAQHMLKLVVDVHKSIADSLRTGSLTDLVRLSTNRALRTLDCLDADDRNELYSLLESPHISHEHRNAFAVLLTAQRYGVWQAASEQAKHVNTTDYKPEEYSHVPTNGLSGALQTALLFDHIYKNVNDAAAKGSTMPGCAGGISFLKQQESFVKSSIFDNKLENDDRTKIEQDESYGFDTKMFCVSCQKPPKPNEDKKWCGPCGLCAACDAVERAKNGSAPLAA